MGTTNEQSSGSQSSTINVAAIERELTSLWQQASREEDSGVIRSSMLNLIVYAPAGCDVNKFDNTMIEITAAHPCRAIVMMVDRESKESQLAAQVTSRCTIPTASTKQVCCEQVTITASGELIDEAPSAVVPLLISDLPVYLWWRAVPRVTDKTLFGRLVDIADRVIIDSAEFNDPHGDLASMAAVLRESPRWTAFSDLNWARLSTWRALMAGFYDVSDYRPLLDHLNSVRIEYAPPSATTSTISTRALLLGGWLASRLGWRFDKASRADKSSVFEFTKDGREIAIEFAPTERNIEPGHIALVTFKSAADESALFTVRRSSDATRIETAVSKGEQRRVQRVLSYESLSESELIGKELEILGHDRVYEQAVLAAGEFIAE
ncbi:MAG TPA: glucose-6-phosphate dehydrogenase assembly protein OpcA [Blastocatellia bacterium]|nr:glucose-6-phosphate dehydrogenase assembly protein OpcA [Blastocatellia bacterium]